MDYVYTSLHHPYSSGDLYSPTAIHNLGLRELPYWPMTRAFPHGVNLGTTGVPNPPRSVAARLLDMEADTFPSKYERRQELDRLKSRRRLENTDWGLLPHDSYALSLHPTHYHPIRTSYSPSDVRVPFRPATPLGRYQVRPHHQLKVAPLSYYRIPMPDPSLDNLTIDYEKEEARIQQAKEARRQQSVRWQSEATDRLLRQCREKNRARNFQRRLDNARLVAPIYMTPDSHVGTRSKVLINYHKGEGEKAAAAKDSPPAQTRRQKRDEELPTEHVTLGIKTDSVSGKIPIVNGVCDEDDTITEQVTIGLHRPKKEEETKAAEESANITITLPSMRRSSSIKLEEPEPVEEVEASASIVIGAPAAPPSEPPTEKATIDLSPKEEEEISPAEQKKKAKKEEKAAAAEKKAKKEEKKLKEQPAAVTPEPVEAPPTPEPIPEPETVSKTSDRLGSASKKDAKKPTKAPPKTPTPEPRIPTPEPEPTPEPKEPTPEPREPTPEPRDPTPEPREPTPEPRDPTPEPRVPTPEPRDPTPEPREPTPEPKEPTPEPREPTPEPKEPTPEPKEPTPEPREATPEPEVIEEVREEVPESDAIPAEDEPSTTVPESTNGATAEEEAEDLGGISRSSSAVRRLVSMVSQREGDSCDPDEWEADAAEEPELDFSQISEGSEGARKRIVLSASEDAIAERAAAAAAEETSTAEDDDTVVELDHDAGLLNVDGGDIDGVSAASTNEPNAEAGSVVTGDNETLSVNGGGSRPLSIDAESLVADDEQVDEEALDATIAALKGNTHDPYENPAEEVEEETE